MHSKDVDRKYKETKKRILNVPFLLANYLTLVCLDLNH